MNYYYKKYWNTFEKDKKAKSVRDINSRKMFSKGELRRALIFSGSIAIAYIILIYSLDGVIK